MLEYIKLILWKVSFDRTLFEKELTKGVAQLDMDEVLLLQEWCLEIFSDRYYSILNSTFCGEASRGASNQSSGAGKVYTKSFPSILGF
ncbi:hypothetical protein [Pontibacter kalidii]|uniref:hypothetical protein n=1 Tax=Pontibacter kalidii TaxID=2592049 RepID=UPI00224DD2DE|nr:hypothetical protein [Pontibacter kalidii]